MDKYTTMNVQFIRGVVGVEGSPRAADEPSSLRLSLNRSQYGGCSTKYNTPAST